MGKKDKATLDKMKGKFIEGVTKKGHNPETCEKVWTDWEAFAQYAFNKSHSTCYAYVAYHTAYLKAHYPAEYMASVLTHNLGNIDKITFFMEESKRYGIPVLGPDINESEIHFSVNAKGAIRFGMGAIKGVGESAAQAIIEERKANGPYSSIFDVVRRINLRAANKKTFENLVCAGAFDSFTDIHRAVYFASEGENTPSFIDRILKYGQATQGAGDSASISLFDDVADEATQVPEPKIPVVEEWGILPKLKAEREVVGIYISGHPLDTYKIEMEVFSKHKLSDLKDLQKWNGVDMHIGGMITSGQKKMTKTGKEFGVFTLEDYYDSHEFALFGKDFIEFGKFLTNLDQPRFLLIRGKVQSRYGMPDQLEFKVQSMELMAEMLDKIKTCNISLPLTSVTEEKITKLYEVIGRHAGKSQLKFSIFEIAENIKLELPSRKVRVKPDKALLEELQSVVPEVSWKLN